MNTTRPTRGLRLWAALLLAGLAGAAPAQASDRFAPFEFALLGDPQVGYGQGGEYADAARLGLVVDDVNARGLPLTVVAGDLVQDRSLWQAWTFAWVARRLQGQVLLAAGNHDVLDRASLQAYRDQHGRDYYDAVVNNVAFIVINSETARDARIDALEFEQQWAFMARSLASHRQAGRTHIVLVMHRPPFVTDEAEPETEQNWPPTARARLLALAREHSVRWILAGHLHRTAVIDAHDGLRILVGAGTSRSFDRSPVAYHRIRVERDALHPQQVIVAPPPREPFAVPGLRGWTPRLFDPSLRHWLFTLLYTAAGATAWWSARQLARRGGAPAQDGSRLWWAIALLLFAYGANMQLDVDELIGEIGRIAAKLTGVFDLRHLITGTAAALVALGASLWLPHFYRRAGPNRAAAVALALLAVPTAFFCLLVISHHDIGMLFNEGWWDLLNLAALLGIALCARRATRPRPA